MKTKKRKNQASPSSANRRKGASNKPSTLTFSRILVPLDFSGQSRLALEVAVPLAERYGGKIVLVHVVQPPAVLSAIPGGGQYLVPMVSAKAIDTARAHLDGLAAKLVPARLLARTLVRQGNPQHEIISAARTLKADLIVITTHGYGGLKRALIGSTAERVVRHAHCPVLAVRRP